MDIKDVPTGLPGVLKYDVIASPDAPIGDVQVAHTFAGIRDMMDYELERIGIALGDKIEHIVDFHPNGQGCDEHVKPYMRRGIGTEVLQFLIAQAVENDVKAICVHTVREPMLAFLKKHGFMAANGDPHFHAKRLDIKNDSSKRPAA